MPLLQLAYRRAAHSLATAGAHPDFGVIGADGHADAREPRIETATIEVDSVSVETLRRSILLPGTMVGAPGFNTFRGVDNVNNRGLIDSQCDAEEHGSSAALDNRDAPIDRGMDIASPEHAAMRAASGHTVCSSTRVERRGSIGWPQGPARLSSPPTCPATSRSARKV